MVARDKASADFFLGRLRVRGGITNVRKTPLNSLPDSIVKERWRINAQKLGAIWATGLSAAL